MERADLAIEGMNCQHCVAAVREGLSSLEGVSVLEVDVGRAQVEFDPSRIGRNRFAQVLDELGFVLRPS